MAKVSNETYFLDNVSLVIVIFIAHCEAMKNILCSFSPLKNVCEDNFMSGAMAMPNRDY